MDSRKLPTAILLLFMVVSLGVLAVKRHQADSQQATTVSSEPAATVPVPKKKPASRARRKAPTVDLRLIVYYFHGESRPADCKTVESLAQEAIESGFAEQLRQQRVQWRVVDYDRPENRHFKIDFDLDGPALVLVRMRGDQQWGWDRLDEAKDMAGDKARFFDLLQRQIRETLGDGGGRD